jgi:serine/threonine protein kinase
VGKSLYLSSKYPVGENYLLIREIGQGSYGTVISAKHIPTNRLVAIKKVA